MVLIVFALRWINSLLHRVEFLSSLKNFVAYKPPLQGTNMQKTYTTQETLELFLSDVNPCDSDGEEIDLQPDSDSEVSSAKIFQTSYFHFILFHFSKVGRVE